MPPQPTKGRSISPRWTSAGTGQGSGGDGPVMRIDARDPDAKALRLRSVHRDMSGKIISGTDTLTGDNVKSPPPPSALDALRQPSPTFMRAFPNSPGVMAAKAAAAQSSSAIAPRPAPALGPDNRLTSPNASPAVPPAPGIVPSPAHGMNGTNVTNGANIPTAITAGQTAVGATVQAIPAAPAAPAVVQAPVPAPAPVPASVPVTAPPIKQTLQSLPGAGQAQQRTTTVSDGQAPGVARAISSRYGFASSYTPLAGGTPSSSESRYIGDETGDRTAEFARNSNAPLPAGSSRPFTGPEDDEEAKRAIKGRAAPVSNAGEAGGEEEEEA